MARRERIRHPETRRALIEQGKRNSRRQTVSERILYRVLREQYGEEVRAQWAISEFIVDFYFPRIRLAVEVDGSSHARHSARARDKIAEEAVTALGGATLRFSNQDVQQKLPEVLAMIHENVLGRVEQLVGCKKLKRRIRQMGPPEASDDPTKAQVDRTLAST